MNEGKVMRKGTKCGQRGMANGGTNTDEVRKLEAHRVTWTTGRLFKTNSFLNQSVTRGWEDRRRQFLCFLSSFLSFSSRICPIFSSSHLFAHSYCVLRDGYWRNSLEAKQYHTQCDSQWRRDRESRGKELKDMCWRKCVVAYWLMCDNRVERGMR